MAVVGTEFGVEHGCFSVNREVAGWLKSDDFKLDAKQRMARVGNMSCPNKSLIDAAVRMGAQVVSDDFG